MKSLNHRHKASCFTWNVPFFSDPDLKTELFVPRHLCESSPRPKSFQYVVLGGLSLVQFCLLTNAASGS